MAAAWDQLGSVREAADELNRGRLGAEVGAPGRRGVADASTPATGSRSPRRCSRSLAVGGEPARALISDGAVPTALIERAWLRPAAAGPRRHPPARRTCEATRAGASPAAAAGARLPNVTPAVGCGRPRSSSPTRRTPAT